MERYNAQLNTVCYSAQGEKVKTKLFAQQVAHHLKTTRQAQGLSLDATAKLTGVSKAMLGQIERRESSPTIATLWKIATGLNTSFSSFLNAENKTEQQHFPQDPNMQVDVLFPWHSDTRMEVFEVTLRNFHQQQSDAHSAGCIEHVLLQSGELQLFFDDQWHTLSPGQQVRFSADQPHRYKALSDPVQFQLIICYTLALPVQLPSEQN